MSGDPIRVGIIGAGANTRKMHIPGLRALGDVDIRCVANRSEESAKKVADEFSIPEVKSRWQDVATSPDIDAVVIGTWPNLHCEATCLALESGKHVLCEARMAMNTEQARRMLETSRKFPGLVAQIVPSPFTLHLDKTIQRLLSEGQLGNPRYVHFEFQAPPSVSQNGPMHWRRDRELSGLNTMVLGIAYESLLRWHGPVQWVSAVSKTFNDTGMDPETSKAVPIDVPDYLSVQMGWESGMQGSMHLDEISLRPTSSFLNLLGEKAGLTLFPFAPDGQLFMSSENGDGQPVQPNESDKGSWRVEEEFISAIRGNEKISHTTFETGVDYMIFTEAVHNSAQAGGAPVHLKDI